MNDDFDSIFDPTNTEPTIEATEPLATEEVSKETEHPPEVEPEAEADTEVDLPDDVSDEHEEDTTGKKVPLGTFLDMRDRMKAAEKTAAEHQARLEEFQRSQQVAASIPNPDIDPMGYANHRFAEIDQQMLNQKIQICGNYAMKTHGAEAVSEAAAWGQTRASNDPVFDQAFRTQADPVEWLISQHRSARQLEDFQRDPEAYARKIAEEKGWLAATAEPVSTTVGAISAPQTKATKVRPTSLSDIPAATGAIDPQSQKESFDSIFNPR